MAQTPLLTSILEIHSLSVGARLALFGLISFRNKSTGLCNPRIDTLCERLGGAARRTVERWLRELRTKGVLTAEWHGRACSYDFHICGKPAVESCGSPRETGKDGAACPATFGVSATPNLAPQDAQPPYLYEQTVLTDGGVPPVVAEQTSFDFSPPPLLNSQDETQDQNPTPRKPPVSESVPASHFAPSNEAAKCAVDPETFAYVRNSLRSLAEIVRMPPPDDGLVRAVMAAAPGCTGHEIHEALAQMYKRDKFRNMRSWGLIPHLIADCYRIARSA